jgi:heavy metal sensor kinase
MKTFRSRLTVTLAVFTAVFLSVFCLLLYLWCGRAFVADLDGDLEALFRADFAANALNDEPVNHVHPPEGAGGHEDFKVFKILVDPQGNVIKSTVHEAEPNVDLSPATLEQILQRGKTFANLKCGPDLYRTLSTPVKVSGTTLVEIIGISQEPMQEALEELRRALLLSLVVGIFMVAMVSNKVAGYLTNPLETILGQLESVTRKGDPGLRLKGDFRDGEIVGLQHEVNAMLERLEQSLSAQRQFVSNASHELRAPLANLTLAIEVCLRRERTSEEYHEALETCYGEARRLNEMCNQLLTLSKSDEGALVLHKQPTDLSELLSGCMARNAATAKLRGVTCQVVADPFVASVDAFKIGQVVDNLLSNAIRYSPKEGIVTLLASRTEDLVEISVSDQGPGMTSQEIEQVFERFYRADPSRQRETGGAGLGLAISRAIVDAHGGKLSAVSTPAQGTTFTVRLPLSSGPSGQVSST